MKYIEPPSKRLPKYLPPPKEPKDHGIIRLILALGTLLIIYIISRYVK